jgi:hypothetical protein
MYRSITFVRVHNGATTSFWFDHWLPEGPISSTHTALFSHSTSPNISVQQVFQTGFDLRLRPRLTSAASHQLDSLLSLLQDITLDDNHDVRLLKLTGRPYTTRDAYAALDSAGDANDIHGRRVWGTRLPNKVKVFVWLYFKNRLSTRVNLYAKHVVDSELCERCSSQLGNRHHVFFGCQESASIWNTIGISEMMQLTDEEAWSANAPAGLHAELWPFVFLTILWRIWDARNGCIFRSENFYTRVVVSRVCDDLVIWRKRLPSDLVDSLLGWCAYLRCCISNSSTRSGFLGRVLLE